MEKSNLMMIVIIVLLVALLGTVAGVTVYAFNMIRAMENVQHPDHWDRTPRELHPDEIGRVVAGDSILTNLSTEGGASSAVARIQVVVGFDSTQGRESDEMEELIMENMLYIRTTALDAIGSRTYQQISAPGGRDELAAELLQRFQDDFRTNMIVDISFYDWIITR